MSLATHHAGALSSLSGNKRRRHSKKGIQWAKDGSRLATSSFGINHAIKDQTRFGHCP
ncbi:hypothetical protein SAMN05444165_7310 [Paraburkholderia phenazinium]|jgi:hypothetical protein|uniref:Uncharacterized protein n=1 Tax=Paraburkholderia phenazinium TaxID=60549 RepID=A0A1N6LH38_9BURK|nr:hypothetical protein SAMN05444165_7310 [Paraburkholderia phenazinium]